MADVQLAIIDQQNTEVTVAVPGIQGIQGQTGDVAVAQDGTQGTPGIRFENDPNTGIYRPGADQLALSTKGTGRLFVDSAGLVGIGDAGQLVIGKGESAIPANSVKAHVFWGLDSVYGGTSGDLIMIPRSSAAANFRVYTGSTTPSERFRITGTGQLSHIGAGSAISPAVSFNGSAPSNSLVINSTGLVGIGTSAPTENLTIYGSSSRLAVTGGSGSSAILLGNQNSVGANNPSVIEAANGALYFGGGNSWSGGGTFDYTMTLTNDNKVGIGNTGPSYKLDVTGGFRVSGVGTTAFSVDASSPNNSLIIDSSGRCLVGTSTNSGGALLQVNGDRIRVGTAKTPASATDTGTAGEICWDANYIYVCTATNTWKRTAIATW